MRGELSNPVRVRVSDGTLLGKGSRDRVRLGASIWDRVAYCRDGREQTDVWVA